MTETVPDNADFGSDAAGGARPRRVDGPPLSPLGPTPVSSPGSPLGSPPGTTSGAPAGGTVTGERAISPIAGRSGFGRGGKAVAFVGLLAGSAVFLAATWSHPRARKAPSSPQEPVKQVVDFASVRAPVPPASARAGPDAPAPGAAGVSHPTLANPGDGAPSLVGGAQGVPALAVGAGEAGRAGSGAASATGAADPKAAALQQAAAARAAQLHAIRSAPLLAFSADVRPVGEAGVGAGGGSDAGAGKTTESSGSELDGLRRGSAIGLARARRLPDRNFLIAAGALLPCVLETTLDTSAPGFVTCRIPRDVYSDNGAVVLMEKGSRVLGEYRSGFSQGRARIFVLWDRITTPGGVAVDVGSPASDALGRAGFDGRIDTHFWQRFGGALLLTSVSGALSAAATADARFANVAQAPNEAATGALQASIGIPPTLTKPQGSEVGVFVSRDLDFSGVYALRGR